MDFLMEDTITAVSTPPGQGGIGIIRISGKKSLDILNNLFIRKNLKPIKKIVERKVYYGYIRDPETEDRIDEVLAVYMKSPRSYTTQDLVEINCHGGTSVLKRVLDLCIREGARPAEPGEFTLRAFLGGRIDLAQAEAVMDLIRAKTDKAREIAFSQLKGSLSLYINKLMEQLTNLLIQLEVRIDFCEEDIPPLDPGFKKQEIREVIAKIEDILKSFESGKIYREGLTTAIVGPPNVGKSTLLNLLLNEERAIVTDIPGTTRDRIEESLNLRGIPLILTDTAGIRRSRDPVEEIGINISRETAKKSRLVILVLDSSQKLPPELDEILPIVERDKTVVIMNKSDLGTRYEKRRLAEFFDERFIIEISLLSPESRTIVEEKLLEKVYERGKDSPAEILLSNARHRDALQKCRNSLLQAQESVDEGVPDDFITIDLQSALDSLGEITGKTSVDGLLDRIFSQFCIGK